MNERIRQVLDRARLPIAIVAGVLLALSFPKLNIAGFAWIAPGLLLASAQGRRGWAAFRLGYVGGLAYHLTALYWLLLIPAGWYPVLGWLALGGYVALYPAVWVWLLAGRIGQGSWAQRTLWTLLGAVVWVALEMIVSRLFSGFPWNLLGTSQYRLVPLIQIASLTGVCGVSFLIVWTSLALYSAVLAILRRPASRHVWLGDVALPFAAVAMVFAFGVSRLRQSETAIASVINVTTIQPSIPQTVIWDPSATGKRFADLMQLTQAALSNRTDLLLWPEAAMPEFNEANYIAITNLIQTHKTWMIFGADDVAEKRAPVGEDRFDIYNAAYLFGPSGRFAGIYRKQNLVIFGEYVPLVRWLPFIKWFTPITGSFTPGDKPVPFLLQPPPPVGETNRTALVTVKHPKTSTLICFEDVFPQLVRDYVEPDTDFLINLTNDGWFGESAEQWQHAAAGVFRAVENNCPLVRSCNNGVTCWIDGQGVMREVFRDARGSVYGPGSLTMQIPLLMAGEKREQTLYNRYGDWLGWGCVTVTAVMIGLRFYRRKEPMTLQTS